MGCESVWSAYKGVILEREPSGAMKMELLDGTLIGHVESELKCCFPQAVTCGFVQGTGRASGTNWGGMVSRCLGAPLQALQSPQMSA